MSKGKQTTLFQSWGPKKHTKTDVPHASSDNTVFDLCSDDEEDDEILAQVADETVNLIENYGNPSRSTDIRPGTSTSHSPCWTSTSPGAGDTDVCNISLGADAFSAIPGLTQMEVPEGYDRSAGKLWIYPTNYPVREYQYNIVHQALFKNTMVTLPTGLGKTFIASVVMYNFYRWYPQGKVIFMAPTKPLVAQQIEACYNIMGIPQHDTAEMTGNMAPTERRKAWHNRRVFFLTPQVLTNDLSRGTCPAEMVKCLVIDEAHKAQGNHAYCQVVRELIKYTKNFRILALSATPGSDIKAVQQVLVNLLISHIELRTEDSIDIKQYSHERKVEKIVVPLGDELTGVRNKYLQIVDLVVNRLKRQGVLYARNTTSLSKFLILKSRDAFRQNPPQQLPQAQYGAVEGDFALAMSLYHGLELLQLHGQRSLYNFLDGIISGEKSYGRTRTELLKNCNFTELMQVLGEKFAPTDIRMSQVPASQRKPFLAGHPKMLKLEEVVLNHFNAVNKDKKTEDMVATRIMIFSQYRDSVTEITDMLKQHRPMVKAMSFIGQSSAGKATKGFTQKEQLKVMKEFREGGYNTLVSTCVGEEGLDIGEVDLIICFDAHKSPIRLVQRMGRTGRKREGRIVMLVTEGKEEQIYNQSQYSKKNIHKAILNGAKSLQFYNGNPRMVPEGWSPTCHKMYITVTQSFKPTKQVSESKADKTKANSATAQRDKKKSDCDGLLSDIEAKELEERIGGITGRKLLRRKPLLSLGDTWDQDEPRESTLSLTEWLPWQNRLQPTHTVQHSKKTKDFVELIQFIELQGQQDSKEDNYGNEMKMFLDKDDILKDGETDDNDGKKSDGQTAMRNRQSSKQDKRKKVRRSEHLPKFESDEESDSDKSLPAVDFCGKNPNDEDKGILAKMSECEDVIMEEENLRNCEHLANKKIPIDELRKDETEKADMRNEGVVSSVVINKELSAKMEKHRIKRKSSIAKGTNRNSIKGFFAKNRRSSVAKHSNKNKSPIRAIVEIIDDDDADDFEVSVPSTVFPEEKIQEEDINIVQNTEVTSDRDNVVEVIDSVSERRNECGEENSKLCDSFSEILPGFVSSSVQHAAPLLENLEGCMESIPSPPSAEEVLAQTECLRNLQKLPPLDLLQLVDEWEKENRHRLIRNNTGPHDLNMEERSKNNSCQPDDSNNSDSLMPFTSIVSKTSALISPPQKVKVSVPVQDLHVGRNMEQASVSKINDHVKRKSYEKDIIEGERTCSKDTYMAVNDSINDHVTRKSRENGHMRENSAEIDEMERNTTKNNNSIGISDKNVHKSGINSENDGMTTGKTKNITDKPKIIEDADNIGSDSDDSDIAMLPSQANFALCVDVLTPDEGEIVSERSDEKEESSNKEEMDEIDGETAVQRKLVAEHQNNKAAADKDCGQEHSSSDEDEFMDTQATFMLASTADFLMVDNRNDKKKEIQSDKKDNASKSEFCEPNFTENAPDRNTGKTKGITGMIGDNIRQSGVLCSAQSKSSESSETHVTFTQALACVHDSEEILDDRSSENQVTWKHVESTIISKGESKISQKFHCINSEGSKVTKSSEKFEKPATSKSEEGTSAKAKSELSDSSDDDFDLLGDIGASFDLGFNLDEDIIPPSPCASPSLSQKSFSQSLMRSRRSLAVDLGQNQTVSVQNKSDTKSVMEAIGEEENADLQTMDEDQLSDNAEESIKTDCRLSDIAQDRTDTSSSCRKADMRVNKTNGNTERSRSEFKGKNDETSTKCRNGMSSENSVKRPNKMSTDHKLVGRSGQSDDQYPIRGETSKSCVMNKPESPIIPKESYDAPEVDFPQDDMDFEEQLALAIEESLKSAAIEQSDNSSKGGPYKKSSSRKTETSPQNVDAESPSSDLNDSFIGRKRRRVAIIDSPVTPQSSSVGGNTECQEEFKTPLKPPDFHQKRKMKRNFCEEDSGVKNKKKHIVSFNIPDISSDEDDFDMSTVKRMGPAGDDISKNKLHKKKVVVNTRKSKSPASDFFDEEAELSGEDDSGDDYEGSELDHYEDSFVGEATQMSQRTAEEMQAVYLKSVRSPGLHMAGKFKLKYGHDDIDVFSQAPPEEESQYLQDSFCVDDDEEEEEDSFIADDNDLGEVTLLHDITCVGRRTRWSKPAAPQPRKKESTKLAKGRRRIQALDESSSGEDVPNISVENVLEGVSPERGKKGGERAIFSSSASSDDGPNTSVLSHSPSSPVLSLKSRIQKRTESKSDVLKNNSTSCNGSNISVSADNGSVPRQNMISEKELRLQRQRQKQEEFRRKMSRKDNSSDRKEMSDFKESDNESSWLTKPIRECNPDDKVIVIVDSREINGSQDIISDLRFQHKCHVIAAQLESCDYIVSNRMCVDRKNWSEFSNGANREKLVERIQAMVELYERPCLILEKDRVKGDEKGVRPLHWTKYVDKTLVQLVQSKVTLFFAENQKETATLISDLCSLENRKNETISVPVDLKPEKQDQLRFYTTIPKLTYVNALNLCHNFSSVSEFVNSGASSIRHRGCMNMQKATDVFNYLKRTFDPMMVPNSKVR